MNGTSTGPAQDICLLGYVWEKAKCPNCSERLSCTDCLLSPDCIACNDGFKDSCVEKGSNLCKQPKLSGSCLCDVHEHCDECNADSACYWCSSKRRCLWKKDPIPPGCLEEQPGNCGTCKNFATCQTCSQQAGCGWCGGQCQSDTRCTSEPVKNCDVYCTTLQSCEACLFTEGCNWCNDKGVCEGSDIIDLEPCVNFASYCPIAPQGSTFDTASFFGGMILVLGICGISAAIYYGYAYYKRRKNYTAV